MQMQRENIDLYPSSPFRKRKQQRGTPAGCQTPLIVISLQLQHKRLLADYLCQFKASGPPRCWVGRRHCSPSPAVLPVALPILPCAFLVLPAVTPFFRPACPSFVRLARPSMRPARPPPLHAPLPFRHACVPYLLSVPLRLKRIYLLASLRSIHPAMIGTVHSTCSIKSMCPALATTAKSFSVVARLQKTSFV